MASMASRRTRSASSITASSSLSSPNTICRFKVLNSASSVFSWVVRSSTSWFELAMRFFSSWISRSVARTLSLRSSSSLSRSSSLWELTEVSVLASRAAFLSLTSQHLSAILVFKEACESYDELFPLWPKRKEYVRLARASFKELSRAEA
jgi:hypothetical protein